MVINRDIYVNAFISRKFHVIEFTTSCLVKFIYIFILFLLLLLRPSTLFIRIMSYNL